MEMILLKFHGLLENKSSRYLSVVMRFIRTRAIKMFKLDEKAESFFNIPTHAEELLIMSRFLKGC